MEQSVLTWTLIIIFVVLLGLFWLSYLLVLALVILSALETPLPKCFRASWPWAFLNLLNKDFIEQKEYLACSCWCCHFKALVKFEVIVCLEVLDHNLLAKQKVNYEIVAPCYCQLNGKQASFISDEKVSGGGFNSCWFVFAFLIEKADNNFHFALETGVVKGGVSFCIFDVDFVFK